MGWRDLLQTNTEEIVAPWIGGRSLFAGARKWDLKNPRPPEQGWHRFRVTTYEATWIESADIPIGSLKDVVVGYLVGDKLIPDSVRSRPELKDLNKFETVNLIEPGLDRFARVSAGRFNDGGPLFYQTMEMPIGPEEDVLHAFLDTKETVDDIPGVVPALDASFRIESWRRIEAERIRREEQERIEKEEKRRKIMENLGDGAGRREVALQDFATAAKAALAIGGAQYLDHRAAVSKNEVVVRFRMGRNRFECTCNKNTLRIMDAGICLIDHGSGKKGDTFFTLESLPGVIAQAQREHKLVIFRHVD